MTWATGDSSQARTGVSNRVFRFVGVTSAALMIPLAFQYALDGHLAMGLLSAGAALLLGLALLHPATRNQGFADPALILTLIAAGVCCLVYRYGTAGVYWTFPLVFGFHIVLDRRPACTLNTVFIVVLGLIMVNRVSWAPALPILGSLALSSIFAGLLAGIIDGQWKGLEELVITDALTGAYNRRYFNSRASKLIEQFNRHGHPASLIMFDIDHFKLINDNHGHEVGDRVLRILVNTVKARIRVVDEIFRMGGEEFVILLPDTELEHAAGLAQVITDMIADVRIIEGGPVTISCGVAELGQEEDARSWLQRSDLALYQAKQSGRGRICIAEAYDPDREPTLIKESVAPMSFRIG